jgi:uncharacterized protein (TIGR00255 family)
MIKSMTGFASLTHEDAQGMVAVTVRAVNHRYLDLQVRAPATVSEAEPAMRAVVQRHIARGRVELSVTVQPRQQPSFEIELNAAFVHALQGALERAREHGLIEGRLAPGDFVRLPQALTIREHAVNAELSTALLDALHATLERTLVDLDRMRVHEGDHLRADLRARRAMLAVLIDDLASAAAAGRASLQARLHDRVAELAADLAADRAAIAQEIVRTAARSDITEEVTRFKAHLVHWDTLSDGPEPCGRKLDFLLQEMNREINTIGSKADGVGVSELIVAAKAELEKLREQVQNVE